MIIRTGLPADIDAVLQFWPTAGASPSPTDTGHDLQRILDLEYSALLVAEDNRRIIGTVIATFDGWRGHLYRLAVDPAARRRGAARALVVRAEELLTEWGAKRVIALVELDHPWAISFWEALGYPHDPRMQRHFKALEPRVPRA